MKRTISSYGDKLRRGSTHEGWIVCVPRRGTFTKDVLDKEDVEEHILVPDYNTSKTLYRTVSNKNVKLLNSILTVNYDAPNSYSVRLLFEETFYNNEDSYKYRVWCIERPLNCETLPSYNNLTAITNLQDAVNLLWSEINETALTTLELNIKEFQEIYTNDENISLQTLKDSVSELYSKCIEIVFKDKKFNDINITSAYLLQNIKIAVETYILHTLRRILLKVTSASVAVDDANLNKIIRNLDNLKYDDLGIRSIFDLFRRFVTSGSINEADELAYLTTSLEASMEYIKSDVLVAKNKINHSSNSEQKLENESERRTSVDYLITCITNGDLSEVENLLSSDIANLYNEIPLCHPLCTCETCETSLAKNRLLNRLTVSSSNEHGSTALHVASFYGQVTIVDYLLNHRADTNVTNNDSFTPLHYASMKGHQNIVLLLLHADANPTIADNYGNTPLHLASDRGHEGCVKALLYFAEHTNLLLDVNSCNTDGDTPLHRASKWGYLGIIEVLLEYGADCKVKNKWGQTPFDIAQSERVTLMLERITPHVVLNNSLVPCTIKVHNSSQMLQLSLKTENNFKTKHSNMRINIQTNKLFAAIIEGDIHLANYYLGLNNENGQTTVRSDLCHPLCCCERCAPMHEYSEKKNKISAVIFNLYNENGETVLHVASTVGCLEIIQLLLDAGANVNIATKFEGRTPLHLACLANKIQAVKIILRCAACNIDAKDFNGDTALHLAARHSNTKLMELLIRSGANTNIRNLQNATPRLELEKQMSKDVVLRILKCNSLDFPDHYFSGID
ncbi:hypothetical protein KPH14_008649 [Odynerus spinipes]|uniref:Uncharacterized protein n=1 Tax=Odynerus spinipes TaxID=1348599 RepID=A0AAD9RTI8_9HYME|nr:hypothetical protein KPH14_008649 [Odynerus spinipes]